MRGFKNNAVHTVCSTSNYYIHAKGCIMSLALIIFGEGGRIRFPDCSSSIRNNKEPTSEFLDYLYTNTNLTGIKNKLDANSGNIQKKKAKPANGANSAMTSARRPPHIFHCRDAPQVVQRQAMQTESGITRRQTGSLRVTQHQI